jgi:hypothetical protein
MIRKSFIGFLGFWAAMFIAIASASAVASLTGKPLQKKIHGGPFLSLEDWFFEADTDGANFMLSLGINQKTDNGTGVYRDGSHRFRTLFTLIWAEYSFGKVSQRQYHIWFSKAATFILAAFFGSYPAWTLLRPRLRGRFRRRRGLCAKCGYNLAGNITGMCPECGNRIAGVLFQANQSG